MPFGLINSTCNLPTSDELDFSGTFLALLSSLLRRHCDDWKDISGTQSASREYTGKTGSSWVEIESEKNVN